MFVLHIKKLKKINTAINDYYTQIYKKMNTNNDIIINKSTFYIRFLLDKYKSITLTPQ